MFLRNYPWKLLLPEHAKCKRQASVRDCTKSARWRFWTQDVSYLEHHINHSATWDLVSFYYRDDDWSDDESDVKFNSIHKHEEHTHSEIIHQCNFGARHLINVGLFSRASLQYQADSNTHDTTPHCLNSNDINNDHGTEEKIKTFRTMLKLIGGTLVGGVKYSDLYCLVWAEPKTIATSAICYLIKFVNKLLNKLPLLYFVQLWQTDVFLIAVSYHSKVARGGWVGYPGGYPTPLVSCRREKVLSKSQ